MMAVTVLIVDDEQSIRNSLSGVLMDEGFSVLKAEDGHKALQIIKQEVPEVVLLDIWMHGIDGIETLNRIKTRYPEIQVIMISGHGNIETAVKATKLGAFDFIEKPLSLDKVMLAISHALDFRRLSEENLLLRKEIDEQYEIIGNSSVIQIVRERISTVAPTDSWVLITGENGAGKELVARAIHRESNRRAKAFVGVNCAAIPEELIESELFGHEKGAFTGATTRKKGKFDLADKGTLFLDEIADMSLRTQSKILRILQERKFERVGGERTIDVDVRVIAATNRKLEEEIERGRFREDLYYRLNVIPINVPALRDRIDDIPVFTDHFLREFSVRSGKEKKEISPEAVESLREHNWPGNVRELKNLIERLVIMTPGKTIEVSDLPDSIRKEGPGVAEDEVFEDGESLKEATTRFEREFILKRLAQNDGNVARTAEQIGIARRNLHRKIRQLGIRVERQGAAS
jgi:two-component system nitrogen regulation response regulator NtrX